MPTYKVKPEPDYPIETASPSKNGAKRYPRIYIPVSPEIIAALEVGGPVVVEMKGSVAGLEESQRADSPNGGRCELQVELREVTAYPTEAEEEAAETDKKEPGMKGAIDKGLGYAKVK
jgi:hypothetical protein